jgi:hypothetical protein
MICVFNDAAVTRNRLLSGLAFQNAPHEVITVDNVAGRFDRATTKPWIVEQSAPTAIRQSLSNRT